VSEYLSDAVIDDFIHTTRQKLDSLLVPVGDNLSVTQRKILEAVASTWPRRRRERLVQGQGVTPVHRDPHPFNFLYPLDTSQATVKLIDWQSWRIDTRADDLPYLMAWHWPPEQMIKSERDYVERYYSGLLGLGVHGYSWDDCWYDCRASIIRCLSFLLAAWSPAQWEAGAWWSRIQYGLAAYDRWGCAEAFYE
jgi:thiamine kinase-like enzyme